MLILEDLYLLFKIEVIIWKSDSKPQKCLNIPMFMSKTYYFVCFAPFFTQFSQPERKLSHLSTCTQWFIDLFCSSTVHTPVMNQVWKYACSTFGNMTKMGFYVGITLLPCSIVCKQHYVNTALPYWLLQVLIHTQLEYSIYPCFLSLHAYTWSHTSESLPASRDLSPESQPLASPSLCKHLGIWTNSMPIIAN